MVSSPGRKGTPCPHPGLSQVSTTELVTPVLTRPALGAPHGQGAQQRDRWAGARRELRGQRDALSSQLGRIRGSGGAPGGSVQPARGRMTGVLQAPLLRTPLNFHQDKLVQVFNREA